MKSAQVTSNQLSSNYPYTRSKTDISSLRGCFNTLHSSVNTKLKNQAIETLHNFFKLECTPSQVSSACIKGIDLSKNTITLKIKDMYFFEKTQCGYVPVDKETSEEGEYSFLPFNPQDQQLKNIAQNFKSQLMEFRSIGDLVISQKDSEAKQQAEEIVDKVQIDAKLDALNLSGITNLTDNPYVLDLSYRDGKDKLLDEYIIENNLLSEKIKDLAEENEKLRLDSECLQSRDHENTKITSSLKLELQEQIQQYKQIADELELIKTELQKTTSLQKTLTQENKHLKDQYNALKAKYDSDAVGLKSRYETDISNLRNQLAASQSEATNYRNQYNSYYNQVNSLNNQISHLQNNKPTIDVLMDKGGVIAPSNGGMRVTNTSYVQISVNVDGTNWNFRGV